MADGLNLGGILDQLVLRTIIRGATHTLQVGPANLTAGTDTAKSLKLTPATGKTDDDYIFVTRISAQGIAPSNISIVGEDLNRGSLTCPLNANLEYNGTLMGSKSSGINFTVRNFSVATLNLIFECATLNYDEAMRALAGAVR